MRGYFFGPALVVDKLQKLSSNERIEPHCENIFHKILQTKGANFCCAKHQTDENISEASEGNGITIWRNGKNELFFNLRCDCTRE